MLKSYLGKNKIKIIKIKEIKLCASANRGPGRQWRPLYITAPQGRFWKNYDQKLSFSGVKADKRKQSPAKNQTKPLEINLKLNGDRVFFDFRIN